MRVKVIVPFYHTIYGSHKVDDVFEVLSAAELSGLVEVLPDEEETPKPVKKATNKKAKQA